MVIHDKEIVALVAEQTKYFNEGAPDKVKVDVLKRIQKAQKRLARGRGDES